MIPLEIVTEVIDGDTFRGAPYEPPVRLAGINAPELRYAAGRICEKNTLKI